MTQVLSYAPFSASSVEVSVGLGSVGAAGSAPSPLGARRGFSAGTGFGAADSSEAAAVPAVDGASALPADEEASALPADDRRPPPPILIPVTSSRVSSWRW